MLRDLDKNAEVRSVALDIAKAFNWNKHDGDLQKFKCYGNFDKKIDLIQYFISNPKMKVF